MDKLSPDRRSANMRAIRSKDTKPELLVRRLTFKLGFRYRLHRRDLPGAPDLAFPGKKKVIFVHGCFWHLHGCVNARVPKSNLDYWKPKLERTQRRDSEHVAELLQMGWQVLIVWECDLTDLTVLRDRIARFLAD
jgi:DNA mismatch endonuclease, patch repair protein